MKTSNKDSMKAKRPYFKKKDKLEIIAQIRAATHGACFDRVPARVANGSHQDAVAYKEAYAAFMSFKERGLKALSSNMTGIRLVEILTATKKMIGQLS